MSGPATTGGDAMDQFKATYFEECAELVDAAYARLADLGEGRQDADTLDALFRAIHSIKGGGGAFGFERMVAFAHHFETLLDLVRSHRVETSTAIIGLLTRALDALSDLISSSSSGVALADGFEAGLASELKIAAGAGRDPARPTAQSPVKAAVDAVERNFVVRFCPRTELYTRANEPLLLLRELSRLGTTSVAADLSRLPDIDVIDAEQAYLGWTVQLRTTRSRDQVLEVFEFVSDDCELDVQEEVRSADTATPTATVSEPRTRGSDPAATQQSIRVEVERVDRVVNLVGELVINQSMLRQLGTELPPDVSPGLISGLDNLSQHLRELQESVMAMRAQPVKSVFSRMPRLVRELASQLGKDVRLAVSGEATEIDKTVIEQLADPLTHLIRNSLDHGLETPQERLAAGKPHTGVVTLSAEHRSGRILIEVSDDGRGINRQKVLAKARERGFIAPDANLSDEEIDSLIFAPSLSTAENVSNISGRGVGMDVVKRNIQALGGRISVESREGKGSRFTLSLPLTLAVLDGMIVAVGSETYLVPITVIVESLRPAREDIHQVVGKGDVLAIRGEYLPLYYLNRFFDVPGAQTDPSKGIIIVVDAEGVGRAGLVVDELLGQQQVVVKSIESNYEYVKGVSGATILGNGRVALILDVASMSDLDKATAARLATIQASENVQPMPRKRAAGIH